MSTHRQFVVCVRNPGYEGTLDLRKIYEVLEDPKAAEADYLRVIDESGEDYLYPREWFLGLDLPITVENALTQLADQPQGSA